MDGSKSVPNRASQLKSEGHETKGKNVRKALVGRSGANSDEREIKESKGERKRIHQFMYEIAKY